MRIVNRVLCCLLLLPVLLANGLARAETYSTSYQVSGDEVEKPYQPYLFLIGGLQDPAEEAFSQVFPSPYFRYGGGFGLKSRHMGIEVMMRMGSAQKGAFVDDVYRAFEISTNELQARFYGQATYNSFTFPAGVGVGLLNVTVDRGYPGIFDRFKGNGLFVGPFIGVQYKAYKNLTVGIEVEYPVGEAQFSDNTWWHNQHADQLEGLFNTTETNFWDTVGGVEETGFDNGGFVFSARVVFTLPTYREPKAE